MVRFPPANDLAVHFGDEHQSVLVGNRVPRFRARDSACGERDRGHPIDIADFRDSYRERLNAHAQTLLGP